MTPRLTLFLSTHGRPPGDCAFTIANDDLPEHPAGAAARPRDRAGLRLAAAVSQ